MEVFLPDSFQVAPMFIKRLQGIRISRRGGLWSVIDLAVHGRRLDHLSAALKQQRRTLLALLLCIVSTTGNCELEPARDLYMRQLLRLRKMERLRRADLQALGVFRQQGRRAPPTMMRIFAVDSDAPVVGGLQPVAGLIQTESRPADSRARERQPERFISESPPHDAGVTDARSLARFLDV
jgi:hypothetical protein